MFEITSHTDRRGTCPRRSLRNESAVILTQLRCDSRVKVTHVFSHDGHTSSMVENHPRWAATAAA